MLQSLKISGLMGYLGNYNATTAVLLKERF